VGAVAGLTPVAQPRLVRAALAAAALGVLVMTVVGPITADPVPVLLGAAALCVVGLTRRTSPTMAWLAAITASFAFATPLIAAARVADPGPLGFARWFAIAAPAGSAAILTLLVATWFATRPERPPGRTASATAWGLFLWLSIAIGATWIAVATGQRADPAFTWLDVVTAPTAWYVPFVTVATAIGVAADLRWASDRAAESLPPSTAQRTGPAWIWALAVATVDQLLPRRAAAAEAKAAAERRQIAGDLHAAVVPSLRRAIEAAEGGGDPTAVLRHLRAADLELERLMTDRWPIVLETFGLVSALEDLAERLERDGAPPISIDVDRSEGRPPSEVERAAWRVAQIALDNAVRHAAATGIEVTVSVDASSVRLVIADDGRGLRSDRSPHGHGRGIADAIRRAGDVGGRATVESTPGRGTSVSFIWPDDRR
jgi:signal transduction histidine kinase